MDMKYIDELMWEIKKCRRELQDAHLEYDIADEDMLDSIAYKIKYLSSRYEALSRRLKNEVFPKEETRSKKGIKSTLEKMKNFLK
jgi:protein subunit release factor A